MEERIRFIVALCSKCFRFWRIVAHGFIIKTIDINDCSSQWLATSSTEAILKVQKQIALIDVMAQFRSSSSVPPESPPSPPKGQGPGGTPTWKGRGTRYSVQPQKIPFIWSSLGSVSGLAFGIIIRLIVVYLGINSNWIFLIAFYKILNKTNISYRVCAWRYQILKSKTEEPLKVLSSSDMRGYQIYTRLQLSSSIASFVWKPAHFELYGGAWHSTKIAFVEKYTVISWFFAILGV